MYEVIIQKKAEKGLSKLPKYDQKKILEKLDIKVLVGVENSFRLRVGDYRIIFSMYKNLLKIEVVDIGHRKDIYK